MATGSSAAAAALGHGDGQQAPLDEVLAAVTRIARAVPVPVTADLEAGYGMGPAELVERLAATGAVGCNLEDTDHDRGGLVDPAAHAERLAPSAPRPPPPAPTWSSTPGWTPSSPAAGSIRRGACPRRSCAPPATSDLGVARVSFGGGLHEATLRLLERMAGSILTGAGPYKT